MAGARRIAARLADPASAVHAALFYGAEPGGPAGVAEILAAAWLCVDPGPDGACGVCRACASHARGNNPDVLAIRPWGAGEFIKLSAIRRGNPMQDDDPPLPLNEFFRSPPLVSRFKVAIFHDAHRMTGDVQNALLKTVEEPLAHARLLFATDEIAKVLPTIRSRCLNVPCEIAPGDSADPFAPYHLGAPALVARIAARPEPYDALLRLARDFPRYEGADALKVSERFLSAADEFDKKLGPRKARAEALAVLAALLRGREGVSPEAAPLLAEAHRRILGNGSASLVLDALFAQLLAMKRPIWGR